MVKRSTPDEIADVPEGYEQVDKRSFSHMQMYGQGFKFGKKPVKLNQPIDGVIEKRPFVFSNFGGYQIGKRPVKSRGELDENLMQKRPFVFSNFDGYRLGKRPSGQTDNEGEPSVYGQDGIEKRPFTMGSSGLSWKIGKRDSGEINDEPVYIYEDPLNDIEKRPFVMTGSAFGRLAGKRNPWYGKITRPYIYNIGKRSGFSGGHGESDYQYQGQISKRPMFMNFGRSFGKRNDYDTAGLSHMDSRADEFILPNYVDPNYGSLDVSKRPFVFNTGFGKRPFISTGRFGSFKFGKRGALENDYNMKQKRPLTFGSGNYFGK